MSEETFICPDCRMPDEQCICKVPNREESNRALQERIRLHFGIRDVPLAIDRACKAGWCTRPGDVKREAKRHP